MRKTQRAEHRRQYPEHGILKRPRSEPFHQQAAEVEYSVQKYARPNIPRPQIHGGEHRPDQKAVTHLH